MEIDDEPVVLAGAPERLVVLVGVPGQSRLDRHRRKHDPPEDALGARPGDLLDRTVHVVEVDREAGGPAAGGGSAELGQPAVVGVQRRPHQLESLAGLAAEVHRRREPSGQHRSGEGHFGVDPLVLEGGKTATVGVGRRAPSRCRSWPASRPRPRCPPPSRQGVERRRARTGSVSSISPGSTPPNIGIATAERSRTRRPLHGGPGRRRRGTGRGRRALRGRPPRPRCSSDRNGARRSFPNPTLVPLVTRFALSTEPTPPMLPRHSPTPCPDTLSRTTATHRSRTTATVDVAIDRTRGRLPKIR